MVSGRPPYGSLEVERRASARLEADERTLLSYSVRARSRVAADAAIRAADERHLRRWVGRGAGGERHNSGRRGDARRNYSTGVPAMRGGDRMWRRSPVCKEMGARRGRSSAASGVVVRRGRCADDPLRAASLVAWKPL